MKSSRSTLKIDPEHNNKVLSSVSSTGDVKLDAASWEKSQKEFNVKTLLGPYLPSELPEDARLLPRRPIWECHGGNTEASCRNIDDGLMGGQNGAVGLSAVHRPCTVDTLVAGGRRVSERFPRDKLSGYTSDFGGAYRQVPGRPSQAKKFGVTMWDAIRCRVVIGLAAAQLFGSRSAPLNFSRYPDWCSYCCSVLFLSILWQCIDDLISMERSSTINSSRESWLTFADCCGWDIPLLKSPPPAQLFRALGVFIDLSPLPTSYATVKVCELRISGILLALRGITQSQRLPPGLASSLVGKLQFTTVAFAGHFGKAMLRSIRRRSYEHRSNMNPQLLATLDWWLRNLNNAPSRPIPWMISGRKLVVTYSDGEGADAGVGVAIWCDELRLPQAGRMMVPECVRRMWSSTRGSPDDPLYDIQNIEGIGPLIALYTWPEVLRGSLWLHFIDNNGALACLVKGGSRVMGTDTIIGMTWNKVAQLEVVPWFDRVDTKSNPVDGLSRGDLSGNWELVNLVFPIARLKAEIRRSRRFSPL